MWRQICCCAEHIRCLGPCSSWSVWMWYLWLSNCNIKMPFSISLDFSWKSKLLMVLILAGDVCANCVIKYFAFKQTRTTRKKTSASPFGWRRFVLRQSMCTEFFFWVVLFYHLQAQIEPLSNKLQNAYRATARENVCNLYGKTNECTFSTIQMNTSKWKKWPFYLEVDNFWAKLKRLYVLPRNDVVITKCGFRHKKHSHSRRA